LEQLSECFVDISLEVKRQGEDLDVLSSNTSNAAASTWKGAQEIDDTMNYVTSARKKKVIICILLFVLLLMIAAIIVGSICGGTTLCDAAAAAPPPANTTDTSNNSTMNGLSFEEDPNEDYWSLE
jgi:hypothetical protein